MPRVPGDCASCGRSEAAHTMNGYDQETDEEYSYYDPDGHRYVRYESPRSWRDLYMGQAMLEPPEPTIGSLINGADISRMGAWFTSGAGAQAVIAMTQEQRRIMDALWHGNRIMEMSVPLTPEERTALLTPEANRRYTQRERARQNRGGIMPDRETYTVHCQLCGVEISAQRSTKMYCTPCRAKAVVLNAVVQQLNKLSRSNPGMLNNLMEKREQVNDLTRQDFAPLLDGVMEIGVLGVLNVVLAPYGSIEFDGLDFAIHPYDSDAEDPRVARPTTRVGRVQSLRQHLTSGAEPFTPETVSFQGAVIPMSVTDEQWAPLPTPVDESREESVDTAIEYHLRNAGIREGVSMTDVQIQDFLDIYKTMGRLVIPETAPGEREMPVVHIIRRRAVGTLTEVINRASIESVTEFKRRIAGRILSTFQPRLSAVEEAPSPIPIDGATRARNVRTARASISAVIDYHTAHGSLAIDTDNPNVASIITTNGNERGGVVLTRQQDESFARFRERVATNLVEEFGSLPEAAPEEDVHLEARQERRVRRTRPLIDISDY